MVEKVLIGPQVAAGETRGGPLRVDSVEGHPQGGADLDGVVCACASERLGCAGSRVEYPDVDAPLLQVFGRRSAVMRYDAIEVGVRDRRTRHCRVGQTPWLSTNFQVRQIIDTFRGRGRSSGRHRG